jgi:hypothetical protein
VNIGIILKAFNQQNFIVSLYLCHPQPLISLYNISKQTSRNRSHKTFWCRFTNSFLKAISFHTVKIMVTIMQWSSLQKSVIKFTPKKFYEVDPWVMPDWSPLLGLNTKCYLNLNPNDGFDCLELFNIFSGVGCYITLLFQHRCCGQISWSVSPRKAF